MNKGARRRRHLKHQQGTGSKSTSTSAKAGEQGARDGSLTPQASYAPSSSFSSNGSGDLSEEIASWPLRPVSPQPSAQRVDLSLRPASPARDASQERVHSASGGYLVDMRPAWLRSGGSRAAKEEGAAYASNINGNRESKVVDLEAAAFATIVGIAQQLEGEEEVGGWTTTPLAASSPPPGPSYQSTAGAAALPPAIREETKLESDHSKADAVKDVDSSSDLPRHSSSKEGNSGLMENETRIWGEKMPRTDVSESTFWETDGIENNCIRLVVHQPSSSSRLDSDSFGVQITFRFYRQETNAEGQEETKKSEHTERYQLYPLEKPSQIWSTEWIGLTDADELEYLYFWTFKTKSKGARILEAFKFKSEPVSQDCFEKEARLFTIPRHRDQTAFNRFDILSWWRPLYGPGSIFIRPQPLTKQLSGYLFLAAAAQRDHQWDEVASIVHQMSVTSQFRRDQQPANFQTAQELLLIDGRFGSLSAMLYLGICSTSSEREGAFHSSKALSEVIDETVLHTKREKSFHATLKVGLLSMIQHNATSASTRTEYAWIPFLMWESLDLTYKVSRCGFLNRRASKNSREAAEQAFMRNVESLWPFLLAKEDWMKRLEILLSASPCEESSHWLFVKLLTEKDARYYSSKALIYSLSSLQASQLLLLAEDANVPVKVKRSSVREAFLRKLKLSRGNQDIRSSVAIAMSEHVGFSDAEAKEVFRYLIQSPSMKQDALSFLLQPAVYSCFYIDDPFPNEALRQWLCVNNATEDVEGLYRAASLGLNKFTTAITSTAEDRRRLVSGSQCLLQLCLTELQDRFNAINVVKAVPAISENAELPLKEENAPVKEVVTKVFLPVFKLGIEKLLAEDEPDKFANVIRMLLGGFLVEGEKKKQKKGSKATASGVSGGSAHLSGYILTSLLLTVLDIYERSSPKAFFIHATAVNALGKALLSILDVHTFWTLLFNAQPFLAKDVVEHRAMARAGGLLTDFFSSIVSQEIHIGRVEALHRIPKYSVRLVGLSTALSKQRKDQPQVTEAVISKLELNLSRFKQALKDVDRCLHSFFEARDWRASDLADYLVDYQKLVDDHQELEMQLLQQQPQEEGVGTKEDETDNNIILWGSVANILPFVMNYAPLVGSAFVRQSWQLEIRTWQDENRGADLEVITLATTISTMVFEERLPNFFSCLKQRDPQLSLADARDRCFGVSPDSVRQELEMLFAHLTDFSEDIDDIHKAILDYMRLPEVVANAQGLLALFQLFHRESGFGAAVSAARTLSDVLAPDQLSRTNFVEAIDCLRLFLSETREFQDAMPFFTVLSQCEELVNFVEEVIEEENLNLIDAVEEHGESFIRPDTISDLDMLRRVLNPVIKDKSLQGVKLLLRIREQAVRESGSSKASLVFPTLAMRVQHCSQYAHGLRDLFHRVARRQELTKTSVAYLLQEGEIYLHRTAGEESLLYTVEAELKNRDGELQRYDRARLEDLKGRAMLQLSSSKRPYSGHPELGQEEKIDEEEVLLREAKSRESLTIFASAVQTACSICDTLTELESLGHFDFRLGWERRLSSFDPIILKDLEALLVKTLDNWRTCLAELRSHYYFFGFYFSKQFWALLDFLEGTHSRQSLATASHISLLRMVNPKIDTDSVLQLWHGRYGNEGVETRKEVRLPDCMKVVDLEEDTRRAIHSSDNQEKLRGLAMAIEGLFQSLSVPSASGVVANESSSLPLMEELSGQRVVLATYSNEPDLFLTVFNLFDTYMGSTDLLRHHFLICNDSTHRDEIEGFSSRVFYPGQPTQGLHCILNFHRLPHEKRAFLTSSLVAAAHGAHKDSSAVVVIVIPLAFKKFLEHLDFPVVPVAPMHTSKYARTLQRIRDNVLVVASNGAGLGKTEYIKSHADATFQKRVYTVPIGDGCTRQSLMRQLANVRLEDNECLHFDISLLENPQEINIALFEILPLGCLQIGADVFDVDRKTFCYVELAATYRSRLQKSLSFLDGFMVENITWSLDKLVVSEEVNSNIQVVCNHLYRLERQRFTEEELHLSGAKKNIVALPAGECRRLLQKYFYDHLEGTVSLNTLHVYLSVLANQLHKFATSTFFALDTLRLIGLREFTARTAVVESLNDVSRDFAIRSIRHTRHRQENALDSSDLSNAATEMNGSHTQLDERGAVDEFMNAGLVRWEDDNQLMVLFHPGYGSITALYRDPNEVEARIRTLVESQTRSRDMVNYFSMNDAELRVELAKFVRDISKGPEEYIITPDNFLKMVMMLLRVDARIPVILMGETGCGKTSLIQFVAKVNCAKLFCLNIHAGIGIDDIVDFVKRCEAEEPEVDGGQIWIFLDEINTCNHLGAINRLICHRLIEGRRVSPNVVFFAACNPYRLKRQGNTTAGLDSEQKRKEDRMSKLVYRVYPLPETMLDYLWDFGSLSPKQETSYIRAVFHKMTELLAGGAGMAELLCDIISAAHEFVREVEDRSAVSMRDVRRCKTLLQWFIKNKRSRPPLKSEGFISAIAKWWMGDQQTEKEDNDGPMGDRSDVDLLSRCIVLAIAHCYRSRLPLVAMRERFDDEVLARAFFSQGLDHVNRQWIRKEIHREQNDYLMRMNLGPGIALNDALRENVFVLLICILLKIPVFLVGKPGSSKTLAMKRIEANLRGQDSKDEFFKTLNEVKVVSYQGSVSSNSEGILLAFKKAKSYASNANESTVVVLIDEVGLAETSPFNPLKVLHSFLEYSDFQQNSDVAVVGISNWSLDAAKMNRAIHIARPEPSCEELCQTSKEIMGSLQPSHHWRKEVNSLLEGLSNGYLKLFHTQLKHPRYANFHGLRDFYSTIKHIGKQTDQQVTLQCILDAVARNFGGIPPSESQLKELLSVATRGDEFQRTEEYRSTLSVKTLIQRNLKDTDCRHLMLLTTGDAILTVIDGLFTDCGVPSPRIMIGSKLRGDQSEAYHYKMLSEIIECMESGVALILKDMDPIYGSLYDMLNQAYTPIAGKMHCRVALGAFSNPMCHVHERFKCVVVVESSKVHLLDPPFLNRFEKQVLEFSLLLNASQEVLLRQLRQWVEDATTISVTGEAAWDDVTFTARDLFSGFGKSTLESLIATVGEERSLNAALRLCKRRLMRTASCDGVLRLFASKLYSRDPDEVSMLVATYFADAGHCSLKRLMETELWRKEEELDMQEEEAKEGVRSAPHSA